MQDAVALPGGAAANTATTNGICAPSGGGPAHDPQPDRRRRGRDRRGPPCPEQERLAARARGGQGAGVDGASRGGTGRGEREAFSFGCGCTVSSWGPSYRPRRTSLAAPLCAAEVLVRGHTRSDNGCTAADEGARTTRHRPEVVGSRGASAGVGRRGRFRVVRCQIRCHPDTPRGLAMARRRESMPLICHAPWRERVAQPAGCLVRAASRRARNGRAPRRSRVSRAAAIAVPTSGASRSGDRRRTAMSTAAAASSKASPSLR